MITVKLSGGLGNQIFQYAFGRSLSLQSGKALMLDVSHFDKTIPGDTKYIYKLDRYRIDCEISGVERATEAEKTTWKIINKAGIFLRKDFHVRFHRSFRLLPLRYFDGYFQSYKYFAGHADVIRQDLALATPIAGQALDISREIEACDAVSVHIRRGDYVTIQKNFQGYGVCSLDYYERAVAEIKKQVKELHFYVFSDDIKWVKENLRLHGPVTYVSEFGFDETIELELMSKCKHNIIANSTFSWWGAWLNRNPEKIVIAPERWVAVAPYSTEDLLPPEWLRL